MIWFCGPVRDAICPVLFYWPKDDNRQVKLGLFKLKKQQKIIMLIVVGCIFMNVQGDLIRVVSDRLIGHDDLLIVLIMQSCDLSLGSTMVSILLCALTEL